MVGLVNIGHETTNVNILDDGVPVLTRDIPVGTRRLREDLQRERGISADEAERMLQGSERATHADAVPGVARRGARGRHRARGGLPAVGVAVGHRTSPALHHRAAAPAFRGSPGCSPTGCGCRCELANPLERLQVARRRASTTMNVDEVAPLLMLPIGLALRSAA